MFPNQNLLTFACSLNLFTFTSALVSSSMAFIPSAMANEDGPHLEEVMDGHDGHTLERRGIAAGDRHSSEGARTLWPIGGIIRISFLDGDHELHETVKKYSRKLLAYANVKFEFVESGNADVRISFSSKEGRSIIGVARNKDQKAPTMDLGGIVNTRLEGAQQGLILHEFGHMLGLLHEHQHPDSNLDWWEPGVKIAYDAQTDQKIREEILKRYEKDRPEEHLTVTDYDNESVMHYNMPFYTNKKLYNIGNNCHLSSGDKGILSLLYPGADGIDSLQEPSQCCPIGSPMESFPSPFRESGCALGWTGTVITACAIVSVGVGATVYCYKKCKKRYAKDSAVNANSRIADLDI